MADRKTSNEVIMWTAEEVRAKFSTGGQSQLARVINEDNSDTLGAGLMKMKEAHIDWTMKYDEMIFVTKGTFVVVHEGKRFEGKPGDMIFIRRGTPVVYEAKDEAEGVYAVFPGWWRQQQLG